MLDDSSGWPCLRFEAVKVRAEQLIPLSAKAAAAIRAQQDHVRRHWPAGSPWLFPGITGNDDGAKAYSHSDLRPAARALAARHRPARPGRPAGHRDRPPVPPHPRDPADQLRRPPARRAEAARPRQPAHDRHYAEIHDTTIREAFDHYQPQRVNIAGQPLGYDPDAPTASAEWVKHNLSTGSGTACPTATAAGRPSRTARTPTPA